MGSKTNTRNATRRAVDEILMTAVLKPKKKLSENQVRVVTMNPRRHKCPGCANGGHRRRTPVFVNAEGVPYRPMVKTG